MSMQIMHANEPGPQDGRGVWGERTGRQGNWEGKGQSLTIEPCARPLVCCISFGPCNSLLPRRARSLRPSEGKVHLLKRTQHHPERRAGLGEP